MPIEKQPDKPISRDYILSGSRSYKVKNGDSWISLVKANGLDFSCNYYKSNKNNSLIFIGSFNEDAKDYHSLDTKHHQFQDD